ncbi:endonuclease domain-containing protein [Phascolarctobacterium sp. Marseille-Q4147]|uniref:endonuclease domain-containing protein n=1 Tax=Phascolarctobacterium sp. Marseille-Q4147 TaxID=2823317 RepID=UPI001B3224B8|nr:endonuclease domain-containing protein [Phascolarctobacterium sp. Marseille-Q4147]QTV78237.1 endonuclease domain-containing protein [Phascolarctobacterium sp. Marseille-Q4147]
MKYNKRLFNGYDKKLKSRADELRKNMTQQEWNLWYFYLRNHRLKWYRQRIIDRFIVDFYCHAAKLVIEIDGKQHYTEQGIAYDVERTQVLQEYGLKVLRYTNQQLEDNFQEVCWDIERNLLQ